MTTSHPLVLHSFLPQKRPCHDDDLDVADFAIRVLLSPLRNLDGMLTLQTPTPFQTVGPHLFSGDAPAKVEPAATNRLDFQQSVHPPTKHLPPNEPRKQAIRVLFSFKSAHPFLVPYDVFGRPQRIVFVVFVVLRGAANTLSTARAAQPVTRSSPPMKGPLSDHMNL